jgi:hypothetical protein
MNVLGVLLMAELRLPGNLTFSISGIAIAIVFAELSFRENCIFCRAQ